ncbi:MAG: type I DNA topoisomerase, partial [Alphaproteobacteria bacterium]|nr:type I DNA topoisomerase [Alphaproteobacteria bacterium]
MKVVLVESPAKAKTINRYLGDNYQVLASYGHVRDLPSKDGSVNPDADFEMIWQADAASSKQMVALTTALKGADGLILATDPDREGEAISWHVQQLLREKKAFADLPTERVVFNEITKSAILEAMQHPRALDDNLVNAYLARRALDYLVGFSISPVLWRKLPGSRSAGRVQSVALRLICAREAEIEAFREQEYWSVDSWFAKEDGRRLLARLTRLDGNKMEKLSISSQQQAESIAARIKAASWQVGTVETKRVRRNPAAPFTTSTLQQEASRKLGFSASRTMQIAQKLYEGINIGSETTGLITYMRTDGVQMSNEAIKAARAVIANRFGEAYLPEKPRIYKTKAANAQEAHEAVRPTRLAAHPEELRRYLDHDQFRLYDLIWKRALASQMEAAQMDQTAVELLANNDDIGMRATGSVLVFDGFRQVYTEGIDESNAPDRNGAERGKEDDDRLIPPLAKGEALAAEEVDPQQHFTQPPPRYSDASLVKEMEELGIGRPSTYASILQVLEKRAYVRKDQRRFIPEYRGRIVSSFLENFFARYVEYGFTADLEKQLDEVSDGKLDWKSVLRRFWTDFKSAVDATAGLSSPAVMEALDSQLEQLFFTPEPDGQINRVCSKCGNGKLELKLGRFGPFIGCNNYPECKYTRQISNDNDTEDQT